ncbi:MAG: recombination protein RecR [Planctomycetes bacterium]|nr:recombination protein RecR [Planctomycetota bacterium]
MKELAEPLQRLIAEFEKLPGVGSRTAERLAYHLLKIDRESAMKLARAIRDVKEQIRNCRICFNMADGEICRICADRGRDQSLICVVEHVRDLIALEKVGVYRGLYHVLQGKVSPQEGKGIDETSLPALLARLGEADSPVTEILLATNPDAEGDVTALVLEEHLKGRGLKLSRLARGLPVGGSIEFANVEILKEAIARRQALD